MLEDAPTLAATAQTLRAMLDAETDGARRQALASALWLIGSTLEILSISADP